MSTDLGGQKLGQYELRERLGRGGMADVYKAFQPGMERFVAIKVMLGHLANDAEFVERFRREARAVGALRHPNIVSVFDFGIERDIYYMVMEFIRGENLKSYIASNPKGIPLDDALRIAAQLADALDYAHKAGMIHRDVKPANIMFVDNSHQQAILTDFGIAQILSQPGLTASGAMVGTPAYLSPEIASGRATTERADIYGLGIILYEMLTGRVPYEADTPMAIIMAHVNAPVPSPAEFGREVPDMVEAIILKAMAKNPDDRYQTAADMKDALDNARAALKDTSRRPVLTDDRTERVQVSPKAAAAESLEHHATTYIDAPARKPPTLWIALGGIGLVAVIAVLLVLSQNRPPEPVVTPTEQPTQIAAALTEEATATEPEPTATQPEPSPTTAPTEVPATETAPSTATPTEAPTNTSAPTNTTVPTNTDVPTDTATPTSTPTDEPTATPAPTEVAVLPANAGELRAAGLLSGLSPLQDEIDALLLDGRVDDAGKRLDTILADDPENIDALAARAILRNFTVDGETALVDADRAIELAPESPLGYIARADVLQNWAIDDDEGTLAAAEQALALAPDNPEALWRVALAHYALDDYEAANAMLERAIAAGANGFRFADFAANFYFYNSRFEDALPYMQIRYNSDPADEYYLRMLVLDLLQLDRAAEAYEYVKNFPAVITDPDDLSAAAFVAYTAGDFAQAREWAETARALSDEAHAATYLLGLISWYGDNDLTAALGYFDEMANVEDFYDDLLSMNYGHDLNLDRGKVLLAAGEYQQAVEAFSRALESAGSYPVIFEGLADAYAGLGDGAAARENLRLALENTYDNPEEQRRLLDRVRTIGTMIAAASPEPTAAPTEEAVSVTIDLMSGLTPLQDEIDMLIIGQDWEEAEYRIDSALEAEPNNIEALTARSLYYREVGNARQALLDADRVIELAPDSPLGYIARSEALLFDGGAGNASRALQAANRALELDPENPHALWRASLAYINMGDWERHIEYLNRAIDAGAQGFRFANFAGEFLHYNGEYERAQPYLEVWYAATPSDLYANVFLAANLIELERYEEAHQTMQGYTGEYDNYDQLAWPAYVAYRAGYYDEARDWANRALAQERNAPGAHYVLGLISWYVDGSVNEAIRHLNVLRGFPTFWDVFLNPDKGHQPQYDLGRILVEAGRTNAAIEAFNRSLRDDARPYTYEALADVYIAENDTEAALENLEAAREMVSDDPDELARLSERIAELGGE